MTPELLRQLTDRARQPTPLSDSVARVQTPMDQEPAAPPSSHSDVSPMDPYKVSLLGGLMDTGSTYAFLKRGTATESNALAAGLSQHPEILTALGAAGNLAVPILLKQLAKKFPKAGKALAANQGALQFGYGATNLANTLNPKRTPTAGGLDTAAMYEQALQRQRGQGRR